MSGIKTQPNSVFTQLFLMILLMHARNSARFEKLRALVGALKHSNILQMENNPKIFICVFAESFGLKIDTQK